MRYTTLRTAVSTAAISLNLSLGGTALAQTGVAPEPAAVRRGAAIYETYCIGCHKKDGVGEPRVPWSIRLPDLIEAMPLNEDSHAWHHSDEQLVATVLDGNERSRLRMPVFRGILSMAEALDVVAYVKSLWSSRILSCQGPAHMRCM